jgi:AcrR family transcriptional regulator
MTEAERRRGRPRTPDLEKRVFAAALDEYARTGWASFTMDGVARRAGVGKSALYLRWPDRQRVLLDSMEALTRPLTVHDSVSEAADLDPLHERIVRMHTEAATRMFLSAIERGELPTDAPVPAAVETLYGAVFIHALALPSDQRAHARAHPAEHAAPLAAFVLAGLGLGDG